MATLKVKNGRILVHIHRCVLLCLWDEVEFCIVYAFAKIIWKNPSCITHQRTPKNFLKRQHSNSKRVNILALAVTIQHNMMKCLPLSELSPTLSALCWFSFIWHHRTLSKHINGNLSKTAAPVRKVVFFFSSHVGNEQKKRQTVRQAKCISQDRHAKEIAYHRDYLSPRWVCAFALWGSVGTNAASHHSPGIQLPITAQLFPTDQAANATQRATVKTQTHLDHAVTLPLKCLSLILLSEGDFLYLILMICIFFSFVLFFTPSFYIF